MFRLLKKTDFKSSETSFFVFLFWNAALSFYFLFWQKTTNRTTFANLKSWKHKAKRHKTIFHGFWIKENIIKIQSSLKNDICNSFPWRAHVLLRGLNLLHKIWIRNCKIIELEEDSPV